MAECAETPSLKALPENCGVAGNDAKLIQFSIFAQNRLRAAITLEIQRAIFKGSWERADQMPAIKMPEFAFIGRSNVGKSSLINMLCNHKGLAKTSAQPGKTQTLNLFEIDKVWAITDLPGYGYAKVSKERRYKFSKMIQFYLQKRENLMCLFVLVDMRIPPQNIDIDFINWCGENAIPFVILGTKCDKLSAGKRQEQMNIFGEKLSETWDELPKFYATSSEDKTGRDDVLKFIASCMK